MPPASIHSGSRPIPCLKTLLFCLVLALPLGGCAHNTIPLADSPEQREIIPTVGAPRVCVVLLADARATPDLGVRSDGSAFVTDADVRAWVSQALAAALSRQELAVSTATSESEARNAGARFLVTGTIDAIQLQEESSTDYSCSMRASIQLRDGKNSLFRNSFSSALSRRLIVPLPSVPQEIMTENLDDLVRPIALAVKQKLLPQ